MLENKSFEIFKLLTSSLGNLENDFGYYIILITLFSNQAAVKRDLEQIIFILNIIRRRPGSAIGISCIASYHDA